MAAYAFARLKFPGRDKIFFLFLTAMMIPPIFTLIPNFVLIKNLGWLNTFPGIVAPFFLMTPFAVFFLRQFFLGISKEVEEAALLDGAGRWKIFRQLIMPMMAAPLATLAVLTYITAWHEYMWPLVTGDSENVRVLTVALNAFKSSTPTTAPPWAPLMAATFLAVAAADRPVRRDGQADGRRDRLLGDQVMKRLLHSSPLALLAAGCGSGSSGARTADGKVLLRYQLWDTNQKPVYQKCADKFEQAEPEHQDPDREQELGRLLERPRPRLHRRHRARRVHRPPRQVPAVRARAR